MQNGHLVGIQSDSSFLADMLIELPFGSFETVRVLQWETDLVKWTRALYNLGQQGVTSLGFLSHSLTEGHSLFL